MRATMRITCLLVSLSFLCHSICSGETSTSVIKTGGSTSKTEPPMSRIDTAGGTTGASQPGDPGKTNEPTQASTTARPTTAVTMAAITATTPHKPATTQPQAPTVTNKIVPPAPSTVTFGAILMNHLTPSAATSRLNTQAPATTADSSGSPVVSPKATTLPTPESTVPSKISVHVGTTKVTTVSTGSPTPRQQSMTHTTIIWKTDQDVSKGVEGTEETTTTTITTVTSHKQIASKAPEPAGSTGTTSTPFTLTKTGPPAVETSGTKAGTTPPQTTSTTTTTTTRAAHQQKLLYSLNSGHEKEEEKDLVELCRRLMANLRDGNCTLTWQHHKDKIQFDDVEISGKVKTSLAAQYFEEITKKPTDNKTLIAILASCGALLIMIVILAVCASHHRKPYSENQQHLTEELHTVENGYHDNPTLEVMEVQPEMQEKKTALNREFNDDGWMVPISNLVKEGEEDTHL